MRFGRAELRLAAFVILFAGVVKWGLASLWFRPEQMAMNPWLFGFELGHIAGNFAAGHGFSIQRPDGGTMPTAWFSPLYPLFLVGIFKIHGLYSVGAAKAVLAWNCSFQAMSAGLLFLLGLRISGRRAGLAAAGLFLVNPGGWHFLDWVWPIHLFALLLLIHFFVLITAPRSSVRDGALAGGTLGLALLADGAAISIAPVTLVHLYVAHGRARAPIALGAAVLAFALIVSPWALRNHRELGSLNPLRGNAGINLWLGNHPGARAESYHGTSQSPWHNPKEGARVLSIGEREYDRECRERAIDQILSHPFRFFADSLTRFSGFWLGEWWTGYRHVAWFYSLGLVTLSALALRGAIRARRLGTGVLVLSVLIFGAPYFLTVHGHGRYRVPIEPVLCLLAALGPPKDEGEART